MLPSNQDILHFVESVYGKTLESVASISYGVINTNYVCSDEREKYIVKFYNFKTKEEVVFEKEILLKLEESSFPAPRLLQNNSGEYISEWNGRPVVLYHYIDGAMMTGCHEENIFLVGQALGSLHSLLINFHPSVQKPRWDEKEIQELIETRGHELKKRNFPGAEELLRFVQKEISQYHFSEGLSLGVTHQDIKPENILFKEGKIAGIVDFDNSYVGVLLNDITTTAIWTCFKDNKKNEKLFEALIRGYESERTLKADEKNVLDQALRWRLLREIFIAPLVTFDHLEEVKKRSNEFIKMYNSLV